MIHQLQIIFFFCPFGILQYKFLSYREVLHVLSELSELSKLSELIALPEVFSSMKKHLLHSALRLGGPLLELLKLRFVSLSSESSIGSHPAFPDVIKELLPKVSRFRCKRNECAINHAKTVRTHLRPGAYVMSSCLWSSNILLKGAQWDGSLLKA